MHYLSGKNILITGVCGTVGSELARALLEEDYGIQKLVGIDNNETELFFEDQKYLKDQRANFSLSDVRDKESLLREMKDIDVVFHCAAFKHVILCERSPDEAVNTNIMGVRNVIAAAQESGVEKLIFTSSDKAVNPTNVMGTSKLMGERLVTAASTIKHKGTACASTRFGNVLGSNGSVIPIFHRQIQKGGPITLTDEEMTRFVMTVRQSVELIIDSAEIVRGGEVFITKMPVIRIKDLAEVMIETLAPQYGFNSSDIKIEIIGSKPGEKLYEELMSDEETRRAIELKNYFSVVPAFTGFFSETEFRYEDTVSNKVTNPYISSNEECMTKSELKQFLVGNNLLQTGTLAHSEMESRYWPGDKEEQSK